MDPLRDLLISIAGAALLAFIMVLMVAGGFALFGPK